MYQSCKMNRSTVNLVKYLHLNYHPHHKKGLINRFSCF